MPASDASTMDPVIVEIPGEGTSGWSKEGLRGETLITTVSFQW